MDPTIWFGLYKELKLSREVFHLPIRLWEEYGAPEGLKWQRVEFNEASKGSLPLTKGLYAMTISARNPDFPSNHYLFYLGEVGATDGRTRTFRKRFQEYLREYKKITRPTVAKFLHSYPGHIDFHYCEISSVSRIEALESKLLTALLPIANAEDIEPMIRAAKRAFK